MERLLEGKRALVTGGTRGIGKAVALAFAENGADVVICATKENPETLEQLKQYGGKAAFIQCDVSDREQVEKTVKEAKEVLNGPVDILCNIAGISPKAEQGMKLDFWNISPEIWQKVLDVNLNSMFWFSKAVAPDMMAQKYGRIINMSSIVGLTNSEHGPASLAYSTSKTAAVGLTRGMAYELAPYNVTVNAVAGGRIATEMSAGNNQYYNDLHMKLIPMKRFGTPKECADLFVFLASEKSSYITGTTTNITGGWFI